MTDICDKPVVDDALPVDDVQSARERAARDQLLRGLSVHLPHLSPAELTRAVEEEYARFAGSRIRDYVPILVERCVRARFAVARTG